MRLELENEHTPMVYSPPEIEVINIKLEKGFAASTDNWNDGEWPDV
jgi:hypothetical protein